MWRVARACIFIFVAVVISSCAFSITSTAVPEGVTSAPTMTLMPTSTHTATWTLSPSPTLTPTATSSPTMTPSPTLALPVKEGTPFPLPRATLSVESANFVIPLARYGKGVANALQWSPDGEVLAVASTIGVYLYDSHGQEKQVLGNGENFDSVAFSEKYIAAKVTWDGVVRVWTTEGALTHSLEVPFSWGAVAFSPDGTKLVAGGENTIVVWNTNGWRVLQTIEVKHDRVHTIALSSTDVVAAATWEGDVFLWNVNTGQQIGKLSSDATKLAFSPDGALLASAEYRGQATVWNVRGAHPEMLQVFPHHHKVFGVAFSPRGDLLATTSLDGTTKIWDVKTGKEVKTVVKGRAGEGIAFSVEKFLAVMFYDAVDIFDEDGQRVADIRFSPPYVEQIALAQDDSVVMMTSGWDTITGYDVRTGKVKFSVHSAAGVALSPNGAGILSALDNTLTLWSPTEGQQQIASLDFPFVIGGVNKVYYNPMNHEAIV